MDWIRFKEKLINSKYHYFHTDNGILLNGDCLKIMKDFPEKSIDLVLTDPPYNIADFNKLTKVRDDIKTNKEAWGSKFKDKWDTIEGYFYWLISVVKLLKMILENSGNLVLFLDRTYTGHIIYLIEKEVELKFRNKIYFEKVNPLPHFRKNNYRSCIEEAIWFTKSFKGNYYINFLSQKEMKQIFKGNIGKKTSNHPTEKYEWMVKPLVIRHSTENGLILDSFLGSGTTAVVTEKLNRRWIGIELNPDYCEIAKKRIEEVSNQYKLFEED